MTMPGDKAKLINATDSALADQQGLSSIYRIEVHFTRSPKQGNLCGAITVFRNNSFDMDLNPLTGTPLEAKKALEQLQEEASKQTEVRVGDPIYFRESDGQWLAWAMDKALELYDKYGGADIIVKAPKLKIREVRTAGTIASRRSNIEGLFTSLRDIDRLLREGYAWDPWSESARRGKINAMMGKR
jgi:hypothetical protein